MTRKTDSGSPPPGGSLPASELPTQRLGHTTVSYRSEPPEGHPDREIHPRREIEPLPEGPPVPDPDPSPPVGIERRRRRTPA